VPTTAWNGAAVTGLAQSPLVAGSMYAWQASCQAKTSPSFPQYGQGCEIGQGAWVQVVGTNARVDAHNKGATGFYRPEDGHFDPVSAGLPDGHDRDVKTDGCVKIPSVKDSSAEPTGFMFSADGLTAYVSIQHSNDGNMTKVDDYATDDVLKIAGFKPVKKGKSPK
jgi:secreted PhoX family phosphatase